MRRFRVSILSVLLLITLAVSGGCLGDSGNNGNNGNNGGGSDTGVDDTGMTDTVSTDTSGATDASEGDTGAHTGDDSGGNGGGGGAQGLEGFCDYYFECGGSSYSDTQECIDESVGYWGECARPELDAYGDCMMTLTCDEWGNPDAYNPAGGPCGDEWSAVRQTDC